MIDLGLNAVSLEKVSKAGAVEKINGQPMKVCCLDSIDHFLEIEVKLVTQKWFVLESFHSLHNQVNKVLQFLSCSCWRVTC